MERRKVPAPMTQEQLEWITEQNQKAAEKATRRTMRRALVGYLILTFGVLAMYLNGQHVGGAERDAIVQSGRVVSVDGCNRDFGDAERFLALLQRLKRANEASFKAGNITPQAHDAAIQFYNKEIARAERSVPDCRKAAKVVTSDPDADLKKIVPLYDPRLHGRG